MFDIENCPAEAWNYEFIVCEALDDRLVYNGCCRSAVNAEEMARNLNYGVVVHNVRIQGYRDPRPMKRFTFSGKWSWDCLAHDLEEAKQKYYNECYPEDVYIANYDDVGIDELEPTHELDTNKLDYDDSTGRMLYHDY